MAVNPLVQVARGMHKASNELTEYHLRSAAQMHMGQPVKIPYHSKVTAIVVDDDRLVVKYVRYIVDPRARESRYEAAYVVADVYTCTGGQWSRTDTFEAVDATFRPHAVHEGPGQVRDEHEQRTRRIYEGDCYRPGASRAPMDNAARTAEGYTTERMQKHWS